MHVTSNQTYTIRLKRDITKNGKQLGISFLRGGMGQFFQGDPYVTYRVPKCVSDD